MECSSCGRALEAGMRILVMGPDVFNLPPIVKGLGVWCKPCVDHNNKQRPPDKKVKDRAVVIDSGTGFLQDGKEEPESWQEWVDRHWEHYGAKETKFLHFRKTGEEVDFKCPEVA